MIAKKFQAILNKDEDTSGCFLEIPFDPKEAFGKVRAPVKVTINGFTFRTTIASMGGCYLIGINKANRDGAGIAPGDKIKVMVESDTEPRVVAVPDDLARALKANKKASAAWDKLSYTHRREYVEAVKDAKKPETRMRRIATTIEMLENKAQ
jgi:uncharacterized protein YdeI (YjbR/CyaY-like superfamily)